MTTYYSDGPWGTGKGSRLTSVEQDNNHWEAAQRVTALENAPSDAVGISNIEVIGSQMMVYLSNGASFGPFTLPTAMLQYKGPYANGFSYNKLDLFTVKQHGLFFVNLPFVGELTFDPDKVDVGGNKYYTKVFGEETYVNDISFSYPGKPGQGVGVDEDFMEYIFVRPASIPADFAKSRAKLGVPASSTLEFVITKNGIGIGLLTFAAGQTAGTFEWYVDGAKAFDVADVLGIKRPTTIDATARRLVATIASNVTE